jgi:hypothetical protein
MMSDILPFPPDLTVESEAYLHDPSTVAVDAAPLSLPFQELHYLLILNLPIIS